MTETGYYLNGTRLTTVDLLKLPLDTVVTLHTHLHETAFKQAIAKARSDHGIFALVANRRSATLGPSDLINPEDHPGHEQDRIRRPAMNYLLTLQEAHLEIPGHRGRVKGTKIPRKVQPLPQWLMGKVGHQGKRR